MLPAVRIDAEWFTSGAILGGLLVRLAFAKAIAIAKKSLGKAQAEAQGYGNAYVKAMGPTNATNIGVGVSGTKPK